MKLLLFLLHMDCLQKSSARFPELSAMAEIPGQGFAREITACSRKEASSMIKSFIFEASFSGRSHVECFPGLELKQQRHRAPKVKLTDKRCDAGCTSRFVCCRNLLWPANYQLWAGISLFREGLIKSPKIPSAAKAALRASHLRHG
jgi:hypothetical protein